MKNIQLKIFATFAGLLFLAGGVKAQTFTGSIVEQRPTGTLVINSDGPGTVVLGAGTMYGWRGASAFSGDAVTGSSSVSVVHFHENLANVAVPSTAVTNLTFKQSVTNTTNVAQNVSFDFFIPESYSLLFVSPYDYTNLDAKATFSGLISWGGLDIWSVSHTASAIGTTASGIDFESKLTTSNSASGFSVDVNLPADIPPNSVVFDTIDIHSKPYTGLLNLGVLNPGETRDLLYSLEATAYYTASGSILLDADGNPAFDPPAQYIWGYIGEGGVDPFGIELDPTTHGITFTPASVGNTVPEPGALGLLGIATFGMWTARGLRRRPTSVNLRKLG